PKFREFFRLDVIARHVVLKIGPPINVHRARNMPSVVKQDVFVRLDDPEAIVFEMFLEPIGFHQRLWMRVLRRVCCHRNRNSIRCGASASEFANAGPRLLYFREGEAANDPPRCRGYFFACMSNCAKRNEYWSESCLIRSLSAVPMP